MILVTLRLHGERLILFTVEQFRHSWYGAGIVKGHRRNSRGVPGKLAPSLFTVFPLIFSVVLNCALQLP